MPRPEAYGSMSALSCSPLLLLLPTLLSCSQSGTVVEASSARPRAERQRSRLKADQVPSLMVRLLTSGGGIERDAWQRLSGSAACTEWFVDPRDGRSVEGVGPEAKACVAADRAAMYVRFTVKDPDVVGGFKPGVRDQHLWTRDTVEVMVDPDGDGDNKDYYEIQVNPQNLVFDSFFDDYNKPRAGPDGPFGHQDWTCPLESNVVLHGTLDRRGDTDQGYDVFIALPWSCFFKASSSPPKPGDSWRVNLYVMDQGRASSWSPILGRGNFHKAERFGRINWLRAPVASNVGPD